jgi:hypothetical protein
MIYKKKLNIIRNKYNQKHKKVYILFYSIVFSNELALV